MQKYFFEKTNKLDKSNKNPYDLNSYSKSIRSNEVKTINTVKSNNYPATSNKRIFVLSDTLK